MFETTLVRRLNREELHHYYKVLYGYYGGPSTTAWVRKGRRQTKRFKRGMR